MIRKGLDILTTFYFTEIIGLLYLLNNNYSKYNKNYENSK